MAASHPAAGFANAFRLPAREFAVVDAGHHRARILRAALTRGRPRLLGTEIIDAHEEGFTTPGELHDEVRRRLAEVRPEAVILVLPQHQVLRHVLDAPAGDPAETRALLEREATSIGGLSDSPWVFDAVRAPLPPEVASPGPPARTPPLVAAFCRQDDLQHLIDASLEDSERLFDVRTAGDALSAAYTTLEPAGNAVLVDLGAHHTTVNIVAQGQTLASTTFASGSAAFTAAIAADRGGTVEAAEVLKRTDPPAPSAPTSPQYLAALRAWIAELEETLREWHGAHPALAPALPTFPVLLAGGGALQPRLPADLAALGERRFEPWPLPVGPAPPSPDLAVTWGALLLSLHLATPAPSLLPAAHRTFWNRQRFWRGLISANLTLAAMLAVALVAATVHQTRLLRTKATWQQEARTALQQAREIRLLAEQYNARMDAFRPVLERQRHTAETLQLIATLQAQRTNTAHWYVLLADALSYAAGSNRFGAPTLAAQNPEARAIASPSTNPPSPTRAFIAEVCLVPEGETMRQALSDLVMDLKRHPLFRNVDVLPAERRHERVATNLYFPERLFALELNLSEGDLLSPVDLPRVAPTNREVRSAFRSGLRPESLGPTNGNRSPRLR